MKATVRLGIALALTVLGIAASGVEQADEEKSREVRKYIDCSGSREAINSFVQLVANQMAVQFKSTWQKNESSPKLPEQFWNDLPKLIASEFSARIDELLDKIVPLYAKHFTLEELKEINRFYESPVGVRLRESQSAISQEVPSVSVQWGQEVALKIGGKILMSAGTYMAKPEEKK